MLAFINSSLLSRLKALPSSQKVAILLIADMALNSVVVLLAYALRLSAFVLPPANTFLLYAVAPLLSSVAAAFAGVYWSSSRSHSSDVERKILLSQFAAAGAWVFLVFLVGPFGFARSVILIYTVFAILGMVLLRKFAAFIFQAGVQRRVSERKPAAIFGAGREGLAVVDAMRRHRGLKPVAFIDTDYTLVGRTVSGLPVYSTEQLDHLVAKFAPTEVVVAKPGLTRSSRKSLVDQFIRYGVKVKILPDQAEMLEKEIQLNEFRPVRVEDLLGRDPVPPDRSLMEKAVKDQVVMVTGAGGSIGSELVRQAYAYRPRKLILLDSSEFALFEIHRSIEAQQFETQDKPFELVPILADVREKRRMSSIMESHGVDIVFHAAAYKHVRMVQENAGAGIENNVFGTKSVAEAAIENKVRRFVLISTDKAVRPTSVMGASKRVAEMVVQSLASQKGHNTIFSMVRFGNVLGSTGSVVPLFREQIENGGPVLVTHPEVSRYFMLIPEAAQLVIQAAAMAEGGEVFLLEMGELVKIAHLARAMIDLSGLTLKDEENENGDIEIKYVGLKEGEKIREELFLGDNILPTEHIRIFKCVEENTLASSMLEKLEGQLSLGGHENAPKLVAELAKMTAPRTVTEPAQVAASNQN
jgi:FlaA1/EpsC-like NDP-sugar epimerase